MGWLPYPLPIEPTVCTVRLTGAPAGWAEVKSTVAGWGRRKPTTPQTAKPMTTMRSPRTTESLPPNDIVLLPHHVGGAGTGPADRSTPQRTTSDAFDKRFVTNP